LGCAASFATLDKLVDKFTLPPAALPIGDASLTHVIKLAAHSTTSPTPTAMRQSFIMTPYLSSSDKDVIQINKNGNVVSKERMDQKPNSGHSFAQKIIILDKGKLNSIVE
jgi:hypothetical protein